MYCPADQTTVRGKMRYQPITYNDFDHLFPDREKMFKALLQIDKLETGVGVLANTTGFVDRQKFNAAYARFRKVYRLGEVAVCRVLQLSMETVDRLHPGDNLGLHWALAYRPNNIDLYDFSDPTQQGQPWYLLTGMVDVAQVRLAYSLYMNCMFPHEFEVNMKPGLAVKLLAIRRLDKRNLVHGQNLRPDLTGKMFRAEAYNAWSDDLIT